MGSPMHLPMSALALPRSISSCEVTSPTKNKKYTWPWLFARVLRHTERRAAKHAAIIWYVPLASWSPATASATLQTCCRHPFIYLSVRWCFELLEKALWTLFLHIGKKYIPTTRWTVIERILWMSWNEETTHRTNTRPWALRDAIFYSAWSLTAVPITLPISTRQDKANRTVFVSLHFLHSDAVLVLVFASVSLTGLLVSRNGFFHDDLIRPSVWM